jgi:hypothetical protein
LFPKISIDRSRAGTTASSSGLRSQVFTASNMSIWGRVSPHDAAHAKEGCRATGRCLHRCQVVVDAMQLGDLLVQFHGCD